MLVIGDSGGANSGKSNGNHVLFVGSAVAFPDVLLRLVHMEFEGIGTTRIDALDFDLAPVDHAAPSLVIVEDRLADLLVQLFDDIRCSLGTTPIAVAYRNPATARQLFALQQREGRLDGLRFLPLNAPVAGWVSMLGILLSGEFVVPGDLLAPLRQAENGLAAAPALQPVTESHLTQREIEVLERVARGHRNKIIAEALGVSEHTVKLHIHHAMSKIGVNNRTAAANWYLANRQTVGNAGPAHG